MAVSINTKKLNGGIVSSPGRNVMLWYTRNGDNFVMNTSFNGLETPNDWVIIKDIDTKWIKSGIVSFNNDRKSSIIKFTTPFVNSDYYVFILSNGNTNLYWSDKKQNQFTISGSMNLGSEISWIAIHKKIGQQTGIRTPKSIYVGERIVSNDSLMWDGVNFIAGDSPFNPQTLPYPTDSTGDGITPPPGTYESSCNLSGWYKNELIIKPNPILDGFNGNNMMNFSKSSDYSVILSYDTNINIYWDKKRSDRVKVGTSYPTKCIINYLFIKSGLDWWTEL